MPCQQTVVYLKGILKPLVGMFMRNISLKIVAVMRRGFWQVNISSEYLSNQVDIAYSSNMIIYNVSVSTEQSEFFLFCKNSGITNRRLRG